MLVLITYDVNTADAAGRKAHALGGKPLYGLGQIVNPQANVVERRGVNGGFFVDVQRLHDVHFHLHRALAHGEDVFIHVFALRLESAGLLQAQHVHPELFHALFVGATNGNLLDAQDLEGACGDVHGCLLIVFIAVSAYWYCAGA